ncbi:carbon-nitrogen hydrolase [Gorgonomyces haynaldii]|nr:carbon-nitrogen hydrolase [Gorgonomyces haynaldii]
MRVGVLQMDCQFREIEKNRQKADRMLEGVSVDLLVLPEMAFTGYCFGSRDDISGFMDHRTIEWATEVAMRLDCLVQVGYPKPWRNSICLVDKSGLLLEYDKHFLYSQDEHWAEEGSGFTNYRHPVHGCVGVGICMDVNPYKFEAPFEDFEFANWHKDNGSKLILLSNNWLGDKLDPMETIQYWAIRLDPLREKDVTVVISNRVGREGEVRFCGSSCVLQSRNSKWHLLGCMDTVQEGVLVLDLSLQ